MLIAIVLGYLLGAMITIVGIKCSGARSLDPGIMMAAMRPLSPYMTVMWPVAWVIGAIYIFCVGFEATADAIVAKICPNVKKSSEEND